MSNHDSRSTSSTIPPTPGTLPPPSVAPAPRVGMDPRPHAPEGWAPPVAPNRPAEPTEGQETVTLTIDGKEVTVAKGTNVLEASGLLGEEVCHFCYHQGLSIAASCRQCLVEIEKMGKLQPSCQVPVAEGMVVHTSSPTVLKARREMLEFTLKNHPIDCPICDKAGECTLQRHYMAHDHQLTRVDVPKIRKPKHKDIGREIVLDAERCILCSRCVRFCEEIPGTAELTMSWRGDHEQIDIADGHRLDNAYSINTVDICPVGALTAKDFRFAIRAWELHATPTTCNGCATGCAVELHTKHEQAYRVVPRFDPAVNGHWMCDEGRYTYKELDPQARVHRAEVDGATVPLADAIATVATRLTKARKLAVVFSSSATNEANDALRELAEVLATSVKGREGITATRYVLGHPRGEGDAILRDADKNPNTNGAHDAAAGSAGDVDKHEAELALELAGRAYDAVLFLDDSGELSEVALAGLANITSVCLASRRTPLSSACSIVLPAASWAEILGTYTNRQGLLRVVQPAWRPEHDRKHRADLLRDLMLAMGLRNVATAKERTRLLADEHEHAELQALVTDPKAMRPTLLRWANMRG
ncbi:2Fe-2S iron-sulfur cluster-binding protein [Paraliomyxa miuraensis]|uniref:2Fe-2S iron-sulfur cluster-binding protein n=1 Tax=Paraliomyxa miuraensis TaxID=376150 RepID=UPI0022525F4B|nr:2Fe-2S iron-sulfur cluster-binding protein [Paraliomyxa miuraensis]MCX4245501.1 2Fe-2S iron-sulfur cluster-binding protein [Paraliomyxa miuraensis]